MPITLFIPLPCLSYYSGYSDSQDNNEQSMEVDVSPLAAEPSYK